MQVSEEIGRRFEEWFKKALYDQNYRYAVEDGRYINCTCWYENKRDGLRARTNPKCIIHGNNLKTGS